MRGFTGYLVKRLLGALLIVFIVSLGVFAIFFLTPGIDAARLIAGDTATPQTLATIRESFGLDDPWYMQYGRMMYQLFISGDLTTYGNRGALVLPQIWRALPVTLSLAIGSLVIVVIVAIPLGVTGVYARSRFLRRLVSDSATLSLALPTIWLAALAFLLSQGVLRRTSIFAWLPPPGYTSFTENPLGWLNSLLIPWLVIALATIGLYIRLLSASLDETEKEEFMRTARAKGISKRRVVLKHGLRASLAGVLSVFALDIAALVAGGSFVVEVIFALPGIGALLYNSVLKMDVPVVLAVAIYSSVIVVLINLIIDLVNAKLDPRVTLK